MIAWSIQAAQLSNCFDQILVSTDDNEIAEISRFWGAETPFMRPSELSDDFVGTVPVVIHALDWLEKYREIPQAICCLYATAPFVRSEDIKAAFQLLSKCSTSQFVITATRFASPIQRALRLDPANGQVFMYQPYHSRTRTQDLEVSFHDAGQFYLGSREAWLKSSSLLEGSKPLILPKWRVQDIDNEEDWLRAELMFKSMHHLDNHA